MVIPNISLSAQKYIRIHIRIFINIYIFININKIVREENKKEKLGLSWM